jgi:hypothetical protein
MDLQMWLDGSDDVKQSIASNIEILALIVKKYKVEDFSKKLLNEVLLKMEELYLFNVDLNIALLNKGILPLADWDKAFGIVVKDAPGNLIEKVVSFLVRFIESTIFN